MEFNDRFERDGMVFPEPTPDMFNFNSPVGACGTCEGYGHVLGIDPDKVVPDPTRSLYDGAVAPWRGERTGRWRERLVMAAGAADLPVHTPWQKLTDAQRELVWNGCAHFKGIHAFFDMLEAKSYKIQNRVMISRYRGRTKCTTCHGTRIGPDARHVFVGGVTIHDVLRMTVEEALAWQDGLTLTEAEHAIAERLLWEVKHRLTCLMDLGLGYLSLMRSSPTLSGGESQRIALSTCVGSALVGSTYVLDEPSIGLHPEDTQRLISVLERLRNQGNTVVVVEHDDDIVTAADFVVDMGPQAGSFGGEVVFSGPQDGLSQCDDTHPSLTAAYRNGHMAIPVPEQRRTSQDKLSMRNVHTHNLQGFDVDVPLRSLVAVSGVSGSGKSTLITQLLVPAVQAQLDGFGGQTKGFEALEGDLGTLEHLEFVDQNPIGKSSRSNPVTYVKAFDEIRTLLAESAHAKARGLKPSHFSFNISGGRCETCEGEGHVTVGMQFMADLKLPCEDCGGKRFQDHVLEVTYKGKNVHEILSMTVDDALLFFAPEDQRNPGRHPAPPRQTATPARRRPGLHHLGPGLQHPQRRRGPAHQAGRLPRPGRPARAHAVRVRRAHHRPARARRGQAPGLVPCLAQPRPFHRGHRTPLGHPQVRRLGDRPRPRRRRTRRPTRARRHARVLGPMSPICHRQAPRPQTLSGLMTFRTFFLASWALLAASCQAQEPQDSSRASSWCGELSPDAYRVLREQGTEPRFSGEFWLHDEDGVYVCMSCGARLFDSGTKFKSNSGWPSFFQPAGDTAVDARMDLSHGMRRMEVVCAACDGHLGHVFEDGPPPTGLRYCINSVALDFVPRDSVDILLKKAPK